LSLKIYLDDCAYAKGLVRLLVANGHEVVVPRQAEIAGRDDEVHLAHAAANGLVLITKNPDDSLELHIANPNHAGIVLIYQDNDPDRDMSYADIAKALANLENAGVGMSGECHVLNAWRF